jgi:L-lysine 2,3-aminomutase
MPPRAVLNSTKEYGIEISAEKKCIFTSHHKDTVQNIRKTTGKLFENVTCLGITVANQAYFHEEVTRSVR